MQYMLRTGRGPEELSREVELPERLREQLESFFDTDLGAVRVRPRGLADGNVAALAGGNIIRFAPGQYRPDTPAGVWTITHEVAHLIQQAASASP